MTNGRRSGYLAAIPASVSLLQVVDLEEPVLRLVGVQCCEALVGGVAEPTHRQQVNVSMSHPRDLHTGPWQCINPGHMLNHTCHTVQNFSMPKKIFRWYDYWF